MFITPWKENNSILNNLEFTTKLTIVFLSKRCSFRGKGKKVIHIACGTGESLKVIHTLRKPRGVITATFYTLYLFILGGKIRRTYNRKLSQ